jgi:hypothetical protein
MLNSLRPYPLLRRLSTIGVKAERSNEWFGAANTTEGPIIRQGSWK